MSAISATARNQASWPLLLAGVLVMLLGLGACAGGDTTTTMEAAPAPAPAQDTVVEPDREVIRNATMSLRVDDVRSSASQVTGIAKGAGGRISSENLSASGEALYADITARVPAEQLDAVIAQVSGLGVVTSLSVTAEDVTAQGVDLDARIEALTTSVTRLEELLATATSTKDLVEIERELSSRQAELDSLVAQRALLSEAVALSTLSIYLSPNSDVAEWTPPGFLSGLESGWNALRTVTAALVTLLGFALPFIVVAAVIAVPIVVLIVALTRRRRRRSISAHGSE